ncbi:MAG: Crp/Fnr family transcriptional regulator [Atopobiaceae bacterium]|nr:Crp/Fnr family transcriptional regulator [Atopobiaceae bacterium]MCH4119063.1 Crp/Fnr family transcriptional regulator [Atopobiaceae bacterium]MCI1389787.1 Crp/Fnr family transcriptional regulator [Atopobiaceae bacterium]MCI1432178.1 Crp/Fnr family transcriptional regulator [Atopobiaceae bacterium]MCI1470636.1 Crp/Fnr family transcriptional regulator [Atopobiaceae bacterium]
MAKSLLKASEMPVAASSSLFRGLDEVEMESIMPCIGARRREFDKDELVIRLGDRVSRVGLVLSGGMYVERYDYWGNRHIVSSLQPGQAFGEAYAASPSRPSGVEVRAAKDSVVLMLELDRVVSMCSSACPFHTKLIRNLVGILAERNLMLNEKLACVTQPTLRDKLLSYLTSEARRQGSPEFVVPFDRQGMAEYLNVNRSALSSELSKLRDEGVLEFRKSRFRLLSPTEHDAARPAGNK